MYRRELVNPSSLADRSRLTQLVEFLVETYGAETTIRSVKGIIELHERKKVEKGEEMFEEWVKEAIDNMNKNKGNV